MRVIFLDFDGVINNCGEYDDYVFYPVRGKNGKIHNLPISAQNIRPIKELMEFLFKNSIKIVLSTSWREIISFSELNDVFKSFFGFSYMETDLIVDEIPSLYFMGEVIRGNEIKRYIEKNGKIEDYLIIDDVFDFLSEQKQHLILTDTSKGFTDKDVKKVKKYFIRKEAY